MPGGSTYGGFMDMAWQLAVAYQSIGNAIKRGILLSVSKWSVTCIQQWRSACVILGILKHQHPSAWATGGYHCLGKVSGSQKVAGGRGGFVWRALERVTLRLGYTNTDWSSESFLSPVCLCRVCKQRANVASPPWVPWEPGGWFGQSLWELPVFQGSPSQGPPSAWPGMPLCKSLFPQHPACGEWCWLMGLVWGLQLIPAVHAARRGAAIQNDQGVVGGRAGC